MPTQRVSCDVTISIERADHATGSRLQEVARVTQKIQLDICVPENLLSVYNALQKLEGFTQMKATVQCSEVLAI